MYEYVPLIFNPTGRKSLSVLGDAGLRPLQAVLTWAAWEKSLVSGYPPPPTPTPHSSVGAREGK
jgi:hypothetical protein